jgi:exodeoxyribonuclease V alpha subunit
MITRNDHVRELSNGDVGVVVRSEDGGLRVVFERSDGYRSYPVGSLPAHELAFAVTVHKAQGSEFERVLLVLPGEGGRRLLTKEIIYTAITRARQFVLLVGSSEALTQAIRQRIDRQSALLRCE